MPVDRHPAQVRGRHHGQQEAEEVGEDGRVEAHHGCPRQRGVWKGSRQDGRALHRQLDRRRQKRGELIGYDGYHRKKGTKVHVAVTPASLPVSVMIGRGNEHESRKLIPDGRRSGKGTPTGGAGLGRGPGGSTQTRTTTHSSSGCTSRGGTSVRTYQGGAGRSVRGDRRSSTSMP